MEHDQLKRQALKKVKAKKGFFIHLSVYLAVGLFFFLMNVATFDQEGEWWFFFPLIPWGTGLLIHYLVIYGLPGTDVMSTKWEHREFEKELEKLEWHEYQKVKGSGSKKSSGKLTEDYLDLEDIPPEEAEKIERPSWDDREFV